ncbi:MAG: PorT family protein [Bacteroidota bacterium]|nr:PorT family protein [Bacteroidota bacterium]
MKKLILVVMAVFFYELSYGQFFNVGPKFGVSQSTVRAEQTLNNIQYETGDAVFGYHIGGFLRFHPGEVLFIQPEVLFTSAGGSIRATEANIQRVTDINYNRLDIPILIGARFGGDVKFRIFAAPMASFLLSVNAADELGDGDVRDAYRTMNWGYQAGIGFDFWNLILDLKYEGHLNAFGDRIRNADVRQTNSQIILSAGFKIFN